MIDERFKIFVEQLRDGHIEILKESFSPDVIDVKEKDLSFFDPVNIEGQVYLAEEMLVLRFDVQTSATIPCVICNDLVKLEIKIKDFYHVVPLSEIKGSIFNFHEILRELILLETPNLAECNQGRCPQRQVFKKYLKNENTAKKDIEEGYRPFADLDFDQKK